MMLPTLIKKKKKIKGAKICLKYLFKLIFVKVKNNKEINNLKKKSENSKLFAF
jgi:hypothetical protein